MRSKAGSYSVTAGGEELIADDRIQVVLITMTEHPAYLMRTTCAVTCSRCRFQYRSAIFGEQPVPPVIRSSAATPRLRALMRASPKRT